jgi:alginate O-acetyltransferase complex protein AlgI
MRPLRSFLLLLIFLACFTGLHYIIPANQLFPSVYEFIPKVTEIDLVQNEKTTPDFNSGNKADSLKKLTESEVKKVDSLYLVSPHRPPAGIRQFLDSVRYSKRQVRVMYYGDSQIEGDRISSYLRHVLRENNPGTGPGLFLPLMPVMYTKTIFLKASSNWERYNYLSYKEGEINHARLGPFMAICRYLPEGMRTTVPEKAFVNISPSVFADSASSVYDVLRIFYGNAMATVQVMVSADGVVLMTDTLKKGKGYYELSCNLNRGKDILIEFEGCVSPDIYGISIESKTGLVLDNISQRGSAGLEFTMVDKKNLKEAFRKLSPDLFILQYGLNIVRNVRNSYSYYAFGLERQLALLKEIAPSAHILVIGLTDMAEKEGDSITSYRNIPLIIDAQKRATKAAGETFWNAYNAMGGRSSIIKWSEKVPPLAQKDYVHFTYPGADTLSMIMTRELFSSMPTDSNRYKHAGIQPDTITGSKKAMIAEAHKGGEKSWISTLISVILKYDPAKPMIFSTPAFWIFFLLVLAGYSIIYKKLFIRNVYLFLVSLFFYYKSGGLFLFLLIFVTLIDFTCGLLMYRSGKKFFRKVFILVSIISNLGILAYFKYTGFFVHTVNDLLGTDFRVYDFLAAFSNSHLGTAFNVSNILLPVGISFFTFQSLSYTFDVYRRKIEPVRNIIDFGFYVSFFPQLVAGPIVRASEFIPQLYNDYHLSKREFSHAIFLISKGLIKKIIISDFIAINFIDRVFDAPSIYSGFENLMAIYGYGLQIYCDFSGYTDIAIGLGLIMGFRLPVNFNSPYKAASVAEFWKRWHISLSRWLKDYLYIPLGGNRKGKIRTNINLLITMLLGGLWHGADLRFIIWGLLHGIGLVINKIWSYLVGENFKPNMVLRAISVFITFQFVNFSWIFFRSHDMNNVKVMFRQIVDNFSPGSYMTVIPAYSSVFLLIIAGYAIHLLPESIKESYRGLFIKMPLLLQMLILMIIAVLLYQMRTVDVMPFIYFRF